MGNCSSSCSVDSLDFANNNEPCFGCDHNHDVPQSCYLSFHIHDYLIKR